MYTQKTSTVNIQVLCWKYSDSSQIWDNSNSGCNSMDSSHCDEVWLKNVNQFNFWYFIHKLFLTNNDNLLTHLVTISAVVQIRKRQIWPLTDNSLEFWILHPGLEFSQFWLELVYFQHRAGKCTVDLFCVYSILIFKKTN